MERFIIIGSQVADDLFSDPYPKFQKVTRSVLTKLLNISKTVPNISNGTMFGDLFID